MSLAPPTVRGVFSLDPARYTRTLKLLAARVPARSVSRIVKSLDKKILLDISRTKNVLADTHGASQKRLILLAQAVQRREDIPAEARKLLDEAEAEVIPHELVLNYDYWTADEILRSTLPEDVEVPSSFEVVGHLAHLNLRPEHEPYKSIIGQVILDKNPRLRTIVNKVGTIDSTFRFFAMEVLAGDSDTMVEVREENCIFRFDYAKVYWNSRLQHEHRRLVSLFKPSELICDVFAGVGPFAIPASKKGCIVYANDLNPEAVRYLAANAVANKSESRLNIYNMDGREFIRKAWEDLNSAAAPDASPRYFDHYVMNLPAMAYQFLDTFGTCFGSHAKEAADRATIHCYLFCKPGEEPLHLIESGLGCTVDPEKAKIHLVRTVAPHKDMYCVSFRLSVDASAAAKRLKRE